MKLSILQISKIHIKFLRISIKSYPFLLKFKFDYLKNKFSSMLVKNQSPSIEIINGLYKQINHDQKSILINQTKDEIEKILSLHIESMYEKYLIHKSMDISLHMNISNDLNISKINKKDQIFKSDNDIGSNDNYQEPNKNTSSLRKDILLLENIISQDKKALIKYTFFVFYFKSIEYYNKTEYSNSVKELIKSFSHAKAFFGKESSEANLMLYELAEYFYRVNFLYTSISIISFLNKIYITNRYINDIQMKIDSSNESFMKKLIMNKVIYSYFNFYKVIKGTSIYENTYENYYNDMIIFSKFFEEEVIERMFKVDINNIKTLFSINESSTNSNNLSKQSKSNQKSMIRMLSKSEESIRIVKSFSLQNKINLQYEIVEYFIFKYSSSPIEQIQNVNDVQLLIESISYNEDNKNKILFFYIQPFLYLIRYYSFINDIHKLKIVLDGYVKLISFIFPETNFEKAHFFYMLLFHGCKEISNHEELKDYLKTTILKCINFFEKQGQDNQFKFIKMDMYIVYSKLVVNNESYGYFNKSKRICTEVFGEKNEMIEVFYNYDKESNK